MDPFHFLKKHRSVSPRGFTLVEMVVVLAIIVIITTVALLGQSSFNQSLILTDTAYTVAFSIRQAQSQGLSSQRFGSLQNAGYGIHVVSGVTDSYILFADILPVSPGSGLSGGICAGHTASSGLDAKPGDCLYTNGTELSQRYTFNKGFTLSSFCGTDLVGVERCSGTYFDSLDVTFLRPNTQATILGVRSGVVTALASASFHITTPNGLGERCVTVNKVGQVSVDTCP